MANTEKLFGKPKQLIGVLIFAGMVGLFACDSNKKKNTAEAPLQTSANAIGVEVGNIAPDIALSQPDGSTITLSSLRGKYILVDFWASWCGPCRRENPNVVQLYAKYKDKNFEIFSVSLDKSREDWLEAIAQDGLTWKHASDLKHWQSSVVPLYGIQGIPMTLFLSPEGKILAKDIRGKELEETLQKYIP